MKASHRKFSRDSMAKSTPVAAVPVDGRFGCGDCGKTFASKAGLSTHKRYCKSKPSSSAASQTHGPGLEPLIKRNNLNAKEAKVYKRKVAHWLMMRKNRELRYGTRSFRLNKCAYGTNDVNLKCRLKKAATSIVGCIQNDHSKCELFSFVCKAGVDPYLYLLPHGRTIEGMQQSVKDFIQESVNDVFNTDKLDRLLHRGGLQTTSHVEAVHRTIRQAAPKVALQRERKTSI